MRFLPEPFAYTMYDEHKTQNLFYIGNERGKAEMVVVCTLPCYQGDKFEYTVCPENK